MREASGIYVSNDNKPLRISSHVRLMLPYPIGSCLVCQGLKGGLPPKYEAVRKRAQASYIIGRPDLLTPASVVTINAMAAVLLTRQILFWLSPDLGNLPSYLLYDEMVPVIRDLSRVFPRNKRCPICGEGLMSIRDWGDFLPQHLMLLPSPKSTSI